MKWSREWAERTIRIYERLTRAAAAEGARLVVWPETAVPGSINRNDELRERLGVLSRETGATLVVGAVAVEEGPRGWLFFDSAFVLEGPAVKLTPHAPPVELPEKAVPGILLGEFLVAFALAVRAVMPR